MLVGKMNAHEFNLGMGQMLVEGGKVEENLARAETMVQDAARKGCQIIILPECLDCGWTFPETQALAQPIPGTFTNRLVNVARNNHIYVVAGLAEKTSNAIYNAAVLISPEGTILLKYHKINELDIAHDLYAPGDSLGVVKTPLGVIGINICADNFPSSLVLGHSLGRMGAQMILSPSAWAVPANYDNNKHPYGRMWKKAYTNLAKLYNMYVIGVSNVGIITDGPWKGRRCIGCSLAVGPGGKVLVRGTFGADKEELIVVPIHVESQNPWGTSLLHYLRTKKHYRGP